MKVSYKKAEIIKIYLSGEEFLDIWKGKYLGNPDYSIFYEETRIEISNPNNVISNGEKTHIVNFRNVEVTGFLNLIEDVEYLPINISNVIFHDRLQIQKGTFLNFYIGRNPGENIFKNGLSIMGGTFKNAVSLSSIGTKSENIAIEIHGAIFETKLRIWSICNASLNISNGDFLGGLSLNGEFSHVFIGGGNYHADIELETLICHQNFQIVGGYYSKQVSHEGEWFNDEFPKFISFVDSGIVRYGAISILGNFVISNIDAKFLNLSYSNVHGKYFSFINNLHVISFNRSIFIQSNNDDSFYINSLTIEDSTILSGCIFRIDKVNICNIIFENIISQGNLYLNKVIGGKLFRFRHNENNIIYQKFILNEENLEINNQRGEFRIKETDLGSSIIFNCNFTNYRIVFFSSKIDNIYLSGSNFPSTIETNEAHDLIQLKNAYSQFKRVFEKNDIHVSNRYALAEIETYRKYLKENREDKGDFLILFLNKLTSNHNTNWIRSLICILIFNLLSFSILLYSLGLRFDFSKSGMQVFFNLCGYFFTYINPIHRSNFLNTGRLPSVSWNALAEFIDSVSKIINAYLIYQFVQSFRKFGKK